MRVRRLSQRKPARRRNRRLGELRRALAVIVSVVVAMSLLTAGPSAAKEPRAWSPRPLPTTPSVPAGRVPTQPVAAPNPVRLHQVKSPAWPVGGSGEAALQFGLTQVGALPIFVAGRDNGPPEASWIKPTAEGAARRVQVRLADRAAAGAAGVDGVVFAVEPTGVDASGRPVSVQLDYSRMSQAFGGGWADRLRLVQLPACALTTPQRVECRTQTPLVFHNDVAQQRISAEVQLGSQSSAGVQQSSPARAAATAATVLAATAGASGSAGTYTATPLAASGSWSAGGPSGSFAWTYPIGGTQSVGGSAPGVALSYDSASLDGRTSASNSQASMVGDGWGSETGFVERSYKPCEKVGQPQSGDLCWAGQNATVSFGGRSGELVRVSASPNPGAGNVIATWRLSHDDGSRIEQLTGAANGTYNGEYWRITTVDGTQYYFGLGHLPGGDGSDTPSNGAWTAPVYGANDGDPCHASTFLASSCQQGWRWKLDYVVDPHANLATYRYDTETNYFSSGIAGQSTSLKSYVRAGTPAQIGYGYRLPEARAGAQPNSRIVFGRDERCIPDQTFTNCSPGNLSAATASHWPDVPYDQNCAATGACGNYSPTFWSTKRLTSITTQVRNGAGYTDVDVYALNHKMSDPGGGTGAVLWLDSITHTGKDATGASTSVAPVKFTAMSLANRVAGANSLGAPIVGRFRISSITSETGGVTTVTYSLPDCSAGSLPAPDANTRRCYPVYWTPTGYSSPQLDWFHKYVVTEVSEADATDLASPARVSRYEYVGGDGAWHRDDSEFIDDATRTWGVFRGYGQVITRTGQAPDPITKTAVTYLRGMNGDATASGSRKQVTVTDSRGGTVVDDNALAGFTREQRTFDGDTDKVLSSVVNDPWQSAVNASQDRPGLPALTSQMVNVATTRTSSLLADGSWRVTTVDKTYDPDDGLTTATDDRGDGTAATPRVCTRTSYARNRDTWMLAYPSQAQTVIGSCATPANAATTLGDSRIFYDGSATLGAPPTVGDQTKTQQIDTYTDGAPVYVDVATAAFDAYGRRTSVAVPAVNGDTVTTAVTTTSFTPAGGGPPTAVTVTPPMGTAWNSTTTFDPVRGLPLQTVDANGRKTELTYDRLGRVTAVWLPSRDKAAKPTTPNRKFTYALPTGTGKPTPTAVTTQDLNDDLTYATTTAIYDSLLQLRQRQTNAGDGGTGRLISDAFYDSHGWAVKTYNPYFNRDTPSSVWFPAAEPNIPSTSTATYDGLGRVTAAALYSSAQFQWQSTTRYAGADRVDATPPRGGTATSTTVDARGRTTALWQYRTAAPTGNRADADVTSYAYNPGGLLAKVTDTTGSNTWTYAHDLRGRIISRTDPDAGTSTTGYDLAGNVATTTDGRGQRLSYSYDRLGRKIGQYTGTSISDPAKLQAVWAYDSLAKGLLTSTTRYTSGAVGPAYTRAVTGFTTGYQPLGESVTIPGTEGKLAGAYTTTNKYTRDIELLDSVTMPAGGGLPTEDLTFNRNAAGLVLGYNKYLSNVRYNQLGQVQRTTLASMPKQVAATFSTDPATGRLLSTQLDKQDAGASVDDTSYTYTPAGTITSIKNVQGVGGADLQCFTYDHLRRLTEAWTDKGAVTTQPSPSVAGIGGCATTTPSAANIGGAAPYWQTFGFDTTGNRTTQVEHNTAGDTSKDIKRVLAYPDPGSAQPHAVSGVTTTIGATTASDQYGYDPAGNTTTRTIAAGPNQTLTTDPEGRLASVTDATAGTTSTYLYDADGAQLIRREPGKTTLLLGYEEITLDTATNTTSALRYYAIPGGALTVVRSSTGTISYKSNDHHGTSNVTIDAATLRVTRRHTDPYGRNRGPQPPTPWIDNQGFLGKTAEQSTGLTHIGARAYDPALGRFISVDPLFISSDPQQMNAYAYANNNPVTYSDPTGLCTFSDGDFCIYGPGKNQITTDGTARDVTAGDHAVVSGTGDGCGGSWCNRRKIVTVFPNGTTTIRMPDGRLILNDVEVNDWITSVAGMPTLEVFGAGFDRYVGAHANDWSWVDTNQGSAQLHMWRAAYMDGYIDAPDNGYVQTLFLFVIHAFVGENMGDGMQGGLPIGGPGIRGRLSAPGGCSFDPDTLVLMFDGSSEPIKDVTAGKRVKATDPDGHIDNAETVLQTHSNLDTDLADLTVTNSAGQSSVIHTTQNHPFWDATTQQWTEAANLAAGHHLYTPSGDTAIVTAVRIFTGHKIMLNLTIANLHTYYVMAGTTPVLVHNEGGDGWTPSAATKVMRGGPFGANYYQMPPDRLGNVYWWSPDVAGHGAQGEAKWKIFTETKSGLEWYADADKNGTYIEGKYKGDVGKSISFKKLKSVNVRGGGC